MNILDSISSYYLVGESQFGICKNCNRVFNYKDLPAEKTFKCKYCSSSEYIYYQDSKLDLDILQGELVKRDYQILQFPRELSYKYNKDKPDYPTNNITIILRCYTDLLCYYHTEFDLRRYWTMCEYYDDLIPDKKKKQYHIRMIAPPEYPYDSGGQFMKWAFDLGDVFDKAIYHLYQWILTLPNNKRLDR